MKRVLAVGLVALAEAAISGVCDAQTVTFAELTEALQVPQDQLARLENGEIISYEIAEKSEEELAMGVATTLSAPVGTVLEGMKKHDLAEIDTKIVAKGNIPATAGIEAFQGFAFEDSDEAEDFLKAGPGDRFNLSVEEIGQLKAAREKPGEPGKQSAIDQASRQYREFLLQRYKAYRGSGLAKIGAYARYRGTADPSAELRLATSSNRVLAKYFPEFHKAWLNYPAALPQGTEEKFRWIIRQVEDRPTATLVHRLWQTLDRGAVIASREYYAGHSYNSSQFVAGVLPYGDKTAVFYGHDTFTDQVAGIGARLKHSIGRGRLRDEMVARLKRLKALIGP
ncbi:MAG: hypothetical protein ACREVJ_08805 [Gammaproteobacteria bacterium]